MKQWIVLVALVLGSALPASADYKCTYYKDLPENLKQYRPGDQELYETQGTMVIPKAISGCGMDLCSAWAKCDNGVGAPLVKVKMGCAARDGKCPTASECVNDQDVIINTGDFKVAEKLGSSTRGITPAEDQEGKQ